MVGLFAMVAARLGRHRERPQPPRLSPSRLSPARIDAIAQDIDAHLAARRAARIAARTEAADKGWQTRREARLRQDRILRFCALTGLEHRS